MLDLISDGGVFLLVMVVVAVFAAMAWIGMHVS